MARAAVEWAGEQRPSEDGTENWLNWQNTSSTLYFLCCARPCGHAAAFKELYMTNFVLRWLQARELQQKLAPLHGAVAKVNAQKDSYSGHTANELRGELEFIRNQRKEEGEKFDAEAALPKVFAIVREMVQLVLGVTPYDTQVLAGLALYRGFIAEMGTGEGKTLTAPFAVAAHWALHSRRVHVSTANDYLAQRDATMMQPLYRALGMTVGVTRNGQDRAAKGQVYSADVVYGTHKSLAQDYLTENLTRFEAEGVMPRPLGAVIIDEADAALIDDARMPVVLTAAIPASQELYEKLAAISGFLVRGEDANADADFYVDGKERMCVLTDRGYDNVTHAFAGTGLLSVEDDIYGDMHQALLLKMTNALAARHLQFKDQHYVVRDGAIVLIDGMTGRLSIGQRWDNGLHQAIEAKEGLPVSPEAMTLARITLQHFFRQYQVMSGMTGTAMDDADELQKVYGVSVVAIPPNKPNQRIDEPTRFYRTQAAKLEAVIADIKAGNAKGQPVLIGTATVEQSAELSQLLTAAGLEHDVLNASQHDREAEIIAGAGAPGAITVSTNMAGRGVDIVLGGSVQLDVFHHAKALGFELWEALGAEERDKIVAHIKEQHAARAEQVRQVGGLRVIGLERYESRRQDRQLRGRCARQGDPGQTVFYLSLEDQLVENFAGEKIRGIFMMLDVKPGEEFEAAMVLKAVDAAQREVEGRAEAARRSLMDFEGVLDSQRRVIYGLRDEILKGDGLDDLLQRLTSEEARVLASRHLHNEDFQETWDLPALRKALTPYGITLHETDEQLRDMDFDDLVARLNTQMQSHRILRLDQVPAEQRDVAARYVALDVLDRLWMRHLEALDSLRRGIHLRGAASQDPRRVYAKEAFDLFSDLIENMRSGVVRTALTWVAQDAEAAVSTAAAPAPAEEETASA